jgi:hypothetical protein
MLISKTDVSQLKLRESFLLSMPVLEYEKKEDSHSDAMVYYQI